MASPPARSEIRYVVLSDLHFGATNSVLTSLRPDAAEPGGMVADPETPSPLIEPLLSAIAHLSAGQDTPPTLVLAGDVLDLALSADEVAANAFGAFADRAFGDSRPIFAPVVYFLPGNHDHHLWEGAREDNYASLIRSLPPGEPIPAPRHTTDLRPEHIRASEGGLLSVLIRRRLGCAGVQLKVAYPNLALVSESGDRAQVVCHGHYTESIYTLMSRLRRALFPDQVESYEMTDVETLEAENFAWIDFFWSTLGRSGEVGIDVARIYADLQSKVNLERLATNLALAFASRPHNPAWLRRIESAVLGSALRHEVAHVARAERGTPDVVLSADGRAGTHAYLAGPVRHQLLAEMGALPATTGLVFGHTHKPFVDAWDVDGFATKVAIANTGGWVVDTAEAAPCQGGAAVLIDDQLSTAVVQLYRQRSGGVEPPQVLAADTGDPGPLTKALSELIDPAAEPWRSVTAAAEELVQQRWKLQGDLTREVTQRPAMQRPFKD